MLFVIVYWYTNTAGKVLSTVIMIIPLSLIVLQDTRGKHGETDRQPNGIGAESPDAHASRRGAFQKW